MVLNYFSSKNHFMCTGSLSLLRHRLSVILLLIATVASCAATEQSALRPELLANLGHPMGFTSFDVSPDGRLLASVGKDSRLLIWDLSAKRIVKTVSFDPAGLELRLIGFITNDTVLVSTPDGELCNLLTGTHAKVRVRAGEVPVSLHLRENSAKLSPDRTLLIAGTRQGIVQVWTIPEFTLAKTFTVSQSAISVLAVSNDKRSIFTADSEGKLGIWDPATALLKANIGNETIEVESAAFSPDSSMLVTGGALGNGAVCLWEVKSGNRIAKLGEHFNPHTLVKRCPVATVCFDPTGSMVISGGYDSKARLWDIKACRAIRTLDHGGWVTDSRFTSTPNDGALVITASKDGSARAWRMADGSKAFELQGQAINVLRMASSTDGSKLVLAGGTEYMEKPGTGCWMWDLKGSTLAVLPKECAYADAFAFLDNENEVGFILDDGTLRIWDASTNAIGKPLLQEDSKAYAFPAIAMAPQARAALILRKPRFDIAGSDAESLLMATKSALDSLFSSKNPKSEEKAKTESDSEKKPKTESDSKEEPFLSLRFWVIGEKEAKNTAFLPDKDTTIPDNETNILSIFALSGSDRIKIAVGGPLNAVKILTRGQEEYMNLNRGLSMITSLQFSPAGDDLLVGFFEGNAALLNLDAKKMQQEFSGHTSSVEASAFLEKGYIATSARDGTVRIWERSTGREVASLVITTNGEWTIFTSNGMFDVSNANDLGHLSWVFPDDPFRALAPEIFMRDYYEPRLLSRLLSGEKLREVRPLQDLNRAQPKVELVRVTPTEQPDGVNVDVAVEGATYSLQRGGKEVKMETGAYDLRLFREGQLVAQLPAVQEDSPVLPEGNNEEALKVWRKATEVAKVGERKTFCFKGLRLPHPSSAGAAVEFSAYAFNADRVKSEVTKLKYQLPERMATVKPKAYLVCVGVTMYESPNWNLLFAGDDARQMEQTLKPRLERAGYEVASTLLVSEGEDPKNWLATKPKLKETLGKIASEATPDDLVLMSFSGHGYTDQTNEFYLLPTDIGQGHRRDEEPSPELLAHCVSGEELSRWMRRIDAGEMILIVDACHSAAVVEQPWFKPGPMGSRGLGQLAYDKRMLVLAASQADDFAIETAQLHQGLLTYALTEDALEEKQADFRPKDGRITLDEWLSYSAQRVPQLHERIAKGEPLHVVPANQVQARAVLLVGQKSQTSSDKMFNRNVLPIPPTHENLLESSLPKKQAFQTPQLFDYASSRAKGIILENTENAAQKKPSP